MKKIFNLFTPKSMEIEPKATQEKSKVQTSYQSMLENRSSMTKTEKKEQDKALFELIAQQVSPDRKLPKEKLQEKVLELIVNGANPYQGDAKGFTIFNLAKNSKLEDTIEVLNEIDIFTTEFDELKQSIREALASDKDLYTNPVIDIDPKSQRKTIDLKLASAPEVITEIAQVKEKKISELEQNEIKLLIEILTDKTNTTRLHKAVISSNQAQIDALLRMNIDINEEDRWGLTALDYSFILNNESSKNKLIAHGAVHGSRDISTINKS